MGLEVIERFVESKSTDRICEDVIIVTDNFAAVIDGASDATGADFDGATGGRFAAVVVDKAICALRPDVGARAFADVLSAALASAVGQLDPGTRWPAAVVTCVSVRRREIWRIGNGNVVIDGTAHPSVLRVDDAAYTFRAAVNAALLQKGMPLDEVIATDPGARAARQLIDIQQHLANTVGPWGYGCINGQRVPDEYLDIIPIPDGASEIIMTSDGYSTVLPTLRQTEAALRSMIQHDPAAIDEMWPIGKTHKIGSNAPDDRAYLRFSIE